MLTIDRLSLTLPPGFEHRAGDIVNLIAERLATMPLPDSGTMDGLRVELTLPAAGSSNEALAGDIATALHRGLRPRHPAASASAGAED